MKINHTPPHIGRATTEAVPQAVQGAGQLVPVKDPLALEAVEGTRRSHTENPLAGILDGINARAISPRQIARQ